MCVNPFWPLLGLMLGGAWLAWPWYALNSFAIGSATRRRELGLVAVGFAGSCVLTLLLDRALQAGVLRAENLGFATLVLIVWKLSITYLLYLTQAKSFQLFEYFGGIAKNGFVVVLLGLFVKARLAALFHDSSWLFVLN